MDLRHKVAILTGASGGVGQTLASALAQQQAALALIGRNQRNLEDVAAKLSPATTVKSYRADLACEQQIEAAAAAVIRDFPTADILIHAAGITTLGSVESSSKEDLDSNYHVNVRAPYLLTRALLPRLKQSKGQIVFLNSTAGLQARAELTQYAASKHALKALADGLRDEVNASGVRVLSLFLGRTATPMQAWTCKQEGREYHPELLIQPEDVASVVINALLLPRTAEVTEIRMRPLAKSY
ncbi:MAG TPA: SDR family NAD(P)-dependent oxidoreductase [Terriglobales bacterium]|nr:SDR family NAD(P)-dependent oxidoreductase [Terriglobales bacterium]